MRSFLRPTHLLFFDHPLWNNLIDRWFDKPGWNCFTIIIAVTVIGKERLPLLVVCLPKRQGRPFIIALHLLRPPGLRLSVLKADRPYGVVACRHYPQSPKASIIETYILRSVSSACSPRRCMASDQPYVCFRVTAHCRQSTLVSEPR